MLISGRHGYIFAAASKNASTSIEGIMAGHADIALTKPKAHKHLPVRGIKREFAGFFGQVAPFDAFLSFGIIRDPIKRIISKFNYRSTFDPSHRLYCGNLSFDEFVDDFCSASPSQPAKVDMQAQFFGFAEDAAKVDVILRIEYLSDDAALLGDRLGFDLAAAISQTRKNENEVKRVTLADIDEDTLERLKKKVQRDVAFYEWVSAQAKAGWTTALGKPQLDIAREDIQAYFEKHRPEVLAESLTNQLRLDKSLATEEQEQMRARTIALEPSRQKVLARLLA